MPLHPDADALIRAVLDRPADDTPRLVLADWLDDTGDPADAAWAAYIRARFAGLVAPPVVGITAALTVPAAAVVRHPPGFLDLLPADRLTVRVTGWDPPAEMRELVPESLARENRIFSLSSWREPTVYLVCPTPEDDDIRKKMAFVLNRAVVLIRTVGGELDAFLAVQYPGEWEFVDSPTMYP